MTLFEGNDKISNLIHVNQFLLPVLNRFGIRLGFKDKNVSQLCNELSLNENFFLAIVNTYSNENYFPETDLLTFSPKLIVDYLQKTHFYYFDYLFPEVERRLDKMLASSITLSKDLQIIKQFYNKYKDELSNHIQEEETKVFPYIVALTNAWESGDEIPAKFSKYEMKSFEQEHTNVDQKIYDLKNIIIKYLHPTYNDNDCNSFLYSIFQFERDLLDHARIEDKILLNKVLQIEKQLKNG